ncbi:unnamed protein product [Schistocephalus solidus]|uniref:Helix-turn-helix domain-containing protein n=1 Tax=Schistocephalus solidus TaxID=70667 RepID=A0A183SQF8_SCHSO|nr:unnamed protein product [Schistocephalus solidus]
MGTEVVRRFIKQMTRVMIDDCYRHLQKYKFVIEQNKRECAHVLGEAITEDLGNTFAIVKRNMLQHFYGDLNSIFPDMQFTREEEKEQQPPFIYALFGRSPNADIETTAYMKATNTTQLLNVHSNHPVAHKRSCARPLFKLIQTHGSNPAEKAREAHYLRDRFMWNGYPKAFISRCLSVHPQRTQPEPTPTIWQAMPYIKDVSEATERIFAGLGSQEDRKRSRVQTHTYAQPPPAGCQRAFVHRPKSSDISRPNVTITPPTASENAPIVIPATTLPATTKNCDHALNAPPSTSLTTTTSISTVTTPAINMLTTTTSPSPTTGENAFEVMSTTILAITAIANRNVNPIPACPHHNRNFT